MTYTKQIVILLGERPNLTVGEIAQALDLTKTQVRGAITALKKHRPPKVQPMYKLKFGDYNARKGEETKTT